MLEYIDHLHEHFIDPVRVKNGRYLAPSAPGYSIGIKPESRKRFSFPGGEEWKK
jgi:L-fuconate dehydratase